MSKTIKLQTADLHSVSEVLLDVIPKRSPKSALECAAIHRDSTGTWLEGGDGELSASFRVGDAGEGIEPLLLSRRALLFMSVQKQPVELAIGGRVTIEADATMEVDLRRDSGFKLQAKREAKTHKIDAVELSRALEAVVVNCEVEAQRYALGAVKLEPDEKAKNVLRCIASDARAIAVGTLKGSVGCEMLIPVRAAKLLTYEQVTSSKTFGVHQTQHEAWFVGEDVRIWTRLIEGRFPKWQDVFPKQKRTTITVDRQALRGELDLVRFATSEESRGCEIDWNAGTITAKTEEIGTVVSSFSCDAKISVSPSLMMVRLLRRQLKTMDDDQITIDIGQPDEVIEIQGTGLRYAQMPMARD